MSFTGVIPARYASSRFPGKPLAIIGGRPMIQRVYEQASKILAEVYVATDDERIYSCVAGFGAKAIMTSSGHSSGTDRCAEAALRIENETGRKIDVIVNIQGDEPFIKPEQIEALMNCFTGKDVEIATLIRKVEAGEDLFNPNHPKVIVNSAGEAIYFSRSVIPFIRNSEPPEWTEQHTFFKHIGLYAYRAETLHKITKLPQSPLEIAESLEQNRWIENRHKIMTAITGWESMGIDTPGDLEKANRFIEKQ
ncbi:MAG: 3-deoxy-manno-octulosonate cytidylyltransferase [Bacteroidales bacterium]|nr:3-deoxy-manno-octulosonate cytidylyltransferase [Bacteroidales bacterium]